MSFFFMDIFNEVVGQQNGVSKQEARVRARCIYITAVTGFGAYSPAFDGENVSRFTFRELRMKNKLIKGDRRAQREW